MRKIFTISKIILLIYLTSLFIITQFPINFLFLNFNTKNIVANIVPFNFIINIISKINTIIHDGLSLSHYIPLILIDGSKSFILNIILFIPMGLILPIIWSTYNSYRKMLLTCLSISISIELLQVISMAFSLSSARAFDTDDIIANVFGGILGLFLHRIINRTIKKSS